MNKISKIIDAGKNLVVTFKILFGTRFATKMSLQARHVDGMDRVLES